MSEEIGHECGIAALYHLDEPVAGEPAPRGKVPENVAALMPAVLLDMQNRGQLAAGLSTYSPDRTQTIYTFKDLGTVSEALRMSHPDKHAAILGEYAGRAAIGHTRYATSGQDDVR